MSHEKLIIATWIYCAQSTENSIHHQVGTNIGSERVHQIYWRCVVNFFRSCVATNPNAELCLFANCLPPEQIDALPCRQTLLDLGVDIIILEKFSCPPDGYYDAWGTQFVIIDILEELSKRVKPEDVILVLDSDCIITKNLAPLLLPEVRIKGALQYTMGYPSEASINGLTPERLSSLGQEYDPPARRQRLNYAGGEWFCAAGTEVPGIASLARRTMQQSLRRHSEGLDKFREEAHLLTYVYAVLGYEECTANHLIKRMWTDPFVHRNITPGDAEIPVWHLPAEKKTSLKKLFSKPSLLSGLPDNRDKIAKAVHVTKGRGFSLHFAIRALARGLKNMINN